MENNQLLDGMDFKTNQSHGEYASFGRRLVAAIIDGILANIVQWVIFGALGAGTVNWADMINGNEEDAMPVIGTAFILAYILNVAIIATYFAYFESSDKQATLGKQAMGIIVTDTDGNRISMARGYGRYFAKIVSAITLLIGYLIQPFTDRKQALHDLIAGTLVYKTK